MVHVYIHVLTHIEYIVYTYVDGHTHMCTYMACTGVGTNKYTCDMQKHERGRCTYA